MLERPETTLIRFEKVCAALNTGGEMQALDFSLGPAERIAIVGPRGSGVEKVLPLTLGETRFHTGRIDIKERPRPGVVFAEPSLDEDLTVHGNLKFFGGLYGLFGRGVRRRTVELAATLGIEPLLPLRADRLSPLEARLVDLARALIHRPLLLLIDDPVAALDDDARAIWCKRLNTALTSEGTALLFTSHALPDPILGSRILHLGPATRASAEWRAEIQDCRDAGGPTPAVPVPIARHSGA